MMATWTLFRLQIRIMRWPLVALTIVIISPFLMQFHLPEEFFILCGILSPTLMILSAALIFGVEYQEGARDYIRTRPISANRVFWSKTMILLAMSLPCALFADNSLHSSYQWWMEMNNLSLMPVTWAVLLSLSMWISMMTVIFRDMVRGLLYGTASIAILAVIVFCGVAYYALSPPWPADHPAYIYGCGDMSSWYARSFTFVCGAVMLLPAVIIICAQWVYQYVDGKLHLVSPFSLLVTSLVIGYGVFCVHSLHEDGRTNYIGPWGFDSIESGQSFYSRPHTQGKTIVARDGLRALSPDGKEILAYTKSVKDNTTEFFTLDIETGNKTRTLARTGKMFPVTAYSLSDAYMVTSVSGEEKDKRRWLLTYLPKDPQAEFEMKDYLLENYREYQCPNDIEEQPDGSLSMTFHGWHMKEMKRRNCYTKLDLKTGEITEVVQEEDVSWKERQVKTGGLSLTLDYVLGVVCVREATQSEDTKPLSVFPYVQGLCFHNRLAAGFANLRFSNLMMTPDEYKLGKEQFLGGKIALNNLTNLKNQQTIRFLLSQGRNASYISIPYRFADGYEDLYGFLRFFGLYMPDKPDPSRSFIALSDKYLLLIATDRVGVWDIRQPQDPVFVGTAPVLPSLESSRTVLGDPRNITPIERGDGAIGIATMNGIYWFEFPALMHKT